MIPHQPIFANIQDNSNLGDMLCNAKAVFPEFSDSPVFDYRAITPGPEPLILGGGGMLHPGVDEWIQQQARKRMVFLVGVGINYHDERSMRGWENRIRPCTLAGLRDKTVALGHERFEYCPCPTAGMLDWDTMRSKAAHARNMVVFQHYNHPITYPFNEATSGIPVITNRWVPGVTLEEIALRLGQYKQVVTNSYHGALWSARMGCAVILWKPFSTRFVTGLPFSCPTAHNSYEIPGCFEQWENLVFRKDVMSALKEDEWYLARFREAILDILT